MDRQEVEDVCLSYLHEYGHFQTLPLAFLHLLFLVWFRSRQRRSLTGWLTWLAALVVAHEAVWEMLSEGYVLAQDRAAYRRAYRRSPNIFLPAFWVLMGGLGAGLSAMLLKRSKANKRIASEMAEGRKSS